VCCGEEEKDQERVLSYLANYNMGGVESEE